MKNVTVSLSEDVARWARVWAAKHDTSVSQMLGNFLKEKMEGEKNYSRAMDAFFGRNPKTLKTGGAYPTRESLHER